MKVGSKFYDNQWIEKIPANSLSGRWSTFNSCFPMKKIPMSAAIKSSRMHTTEINRFSETPKTESKKPNWLMGGYLNSVQHLVHPCFAIILPLIRIEKAHHFPLKHLEYRHRGLYGHRTKTIPDKTIKIRQSRHDSHKEQSKTSPKMKICCSVLCFTSRKLR